MVSEMTTTAMWKCKRCGHRDTELNVNGTCKNCASEHVVADLGEIEDRMGMAFPTGPISIKLNEAQARELLAGIDNIIHEYQMGRFKAIRQDELRALRELRDAINGRAYRH